MFSPATPAFSPLLPGGDPAVSSLASGRSGNSPEIAEADGTGCSRDWLLWQLADSAFPTGGFAHSAGLEAAWQLGEVRMAGELAAFLEASLGQCVHGSVPFMNAAFQAPDRWPELDALCEAFVTNHVANRASRLQGQALVHSAERIFGFPAFESGREPPERALRKHLAPALGVLTRWLGLTRIEAVRLFLFLHLRGLLAAAVRLGIAGPYQAQSIQHALGVQLEQLIMKGAALSLEDAAQVSPLLDLWQATHDRLYSRLFQS